MVLFLVNPEFGTHSGSESAEKGLDLRLTFTTSPSFGGWIVVLPGAPMIKLVKFA